MAQKKVWEFEGDWYIQIGENLPFCINTEEVANELANYISNQVDKPVKPACDIDISNIKWGQNTIKIYGHEWYDNGIWKIEIFNPFDDLEFEYKIMDNDADKDYTLWDFIEEAMIKYNESHKSV